MNSPIREFQTLSERIGKHQEEIEATMGIDMHQPRILST
jgi:hypothetical protein